MTADIKNELHKLIDNCDNELLLSEAKALLESGPEVKDWWDELTEEDKTLLWSQKKNMKKGNFITH